MLHLICLVLVALQLGLPRRWAFLPLLIAACHTPYLPFLGGFTVARVVIVVGLMRAAASGSLSWSFRNPLDLLMLCFAAVASVSVIGHDSEYSNPVTIRIRLLLDIGGTYLYARAWLPNRESLDHFRKGLVYVLVPFAIFMAFEQRTARNAYAAIGAQRSESLVRDGKIRAQGPFGTPILAGTSGAACIPLFLPWWRERRRLAVVGLAACGVITLSSASSGPIATAMLGLGGACMWRFRERLKILLPATALLLVVLHFVKERPVWYLMALMDFVGGSTGWHRAYLIDMAVKHLDEWWLFGTDVTKHWMPYALSPDGEHCDLTNYYIHLGVIGGLPLVISLIAIVWKCFRVVGASLTGEDGGDERDGFTRWCVGACLFAHAITFLSISYFDQMYVFYWMLVGGLSGFVLREPAAAAAEESAATVDEEPPPVREARFARGPW